MRPPFIVIFLASATVLLPLASIAWLWAGKYKSRTDWALKVLTAFSAVLLSFLAGTWVYLSCNLKYLSMVLFMAAVIKSFPLRADRKIFGKRNRKGQVNYNMRLTALGVFALLDLMAIKGGYFKGEPFPLSFPLKEGKYLVMQGGASRLTNLFHGGGGQGYALDLVKLNRYGNRASGVFPEELTGYSVYGEPVYAPCTGKVLESVDGVQDNPPGRMDRSNAAGNRVVLECGQGRVMLAHLMNGSVRVKENAYLMEGQMFGRVGNSGYSLEPHLHIQVINKDAFDEGLPMTFEGRFLKINSVYKN